MNHGQKFIELVDQAKKEITEYSPESLHSRIEANDQLILIDCREYEEWVNGIIPKAKHLSKGVIERDIETKVPDTSKEIIIYCGGGYRSALAAQNLKKMGYHNVLSLAEGFRGWKERGLPIISPSDE